MPHDFKKLVDLTEEICNIERETERRRKQLEELVEQSLDGYWDWHVPSNEEYMSDKFWEILGQDPKTKTKDPKEWMDLVHPDDLPNVLKTMKEHFESKGAIPFVSEDRYIKPDGSVVWILCKREVIEWDCDKPIRMVGNHSDITSLKEDSWQK